VASLASDRLLFPVSESGYIGLDTWTSALDAAGIGHLARDSEGSIRERLNARARSRESGAATRVLPLTGAVVVTTCSIVVF
jgi:hypothetical protein